MELELLDALLELELLLVEAKDDRELDENIKLDTDWVELEEILKDEFVIELDGSCEELDNEDFFDFESAPQAVSNKLINSVLTNAIWIFMGLHSRVETELIKPQ